MIDFPLQPIPYRILQWALWRWLHKNCWWLIIMAQGEHFTLALPSFPYPALISALSRLAAPWGQHDTHESGSIGCCVGSSEIHYWCYRLSLCAFSSYQSCYSRCWGRTLDAFLEVLSEKIISSLASSIQTVNRESKQVDVNLFCCLQYSIWSVGNNPKCQHVSN